MLRSAALASLLCSFTASGADLALGVGSSRPAGRPAERQIRPTALLNLGLDFWRLPGAAIGLEIPAAFGGSGRTDVGRASAGSWSVYSERLTIALTPGLRVRIAPRARLTPWISMGAGGAILRRTGTTGNFFTTLLRASQTDSNLTVALAPAAGLDLRMGGRWFLRVESRNYLYKTPSNGFVASFENWGRWNYNPVFAISAGWRSRD